MSYLRERVKAMSRRFMYVGGMSGNKLVVGHGVGGWQVSITGITVGYYFWDGAAGVSWFFTENHDSHDSKIIFFISGQIW